MIAAAAQADAGTWTAIGLLAASLVVDFIQMLRRRGTISSETGKFEGNSPIRHVIVAALLMFLTLHLAFFP